MAELLPQSWYEDQNVVGLAQALLGKLLVTHFEGQYTSALITETEAYKAPEDRASHAWNNRRTSRTEVLFAQGGVAYVYLCYGIHHLFNVVTGPRDVPHAVLIRAIVDIEGEETMLSRRGLTSAKRGWLTGPGVAAKALGLKVSHSGLPLYDQNSLVQIFDKGQKVKSSEIKSGPRIGVDYAGADAFLPWRFQWINRHTS